MLDLHFFEGYFISSIIVPNTFLHADSTQSASSWDSQILLHTSSANTVAPSSAPPPALHPQNESFEVFGDFLTALMQTEC